MGDWGISSTWLVLREEYGDVLPLAEDGEPWAMRRMAELCELFDRDAEARTWWLRAAAAGERDAIMHLAEERR